MKTRLITSLTMGIEVLSAMLGIPLPLWLAFFRLRIFSTSIFSPNYHLPTIHS